MLPLERPFSGGAALAPRIVKLSELRVDPERLGLQLTLGLLDREPTLGWARTRKVGGGQGAGKDELRIEPEHLAEPSTEGEAVYDLGPCAVPGPVKLPFGQFDEHRP